MNPTEFAQFIRDIDSTLIERGTSISARPIAAIQEAGVRLRCGLPITMPGRALLAKSGDYAGESLSAHILDWMELRYGKRLAIDPTLGMCAVGIAGDAWLMQIPFIIGKAFYPGWYRDLIEREPGRGPTNILEGNKLNVLNLVDGLTQGLAKEIPPGVAMEAVQTFQWAFVSFKVFGLEHRTDGLASNLCADLRLSAVDAIAPYTRNRSKWHSLQAAEKGLKFYIGHKGGSYTKRHGLAEYADGAFALGLPPIASELLSGAQYHAGSRYELHDVPARDAIDAHQAALQICFSVASALPR